LRKILVLFILIYGQLFALDKESTLKIYHHVFSALTQKGSITVYTKDPEYKKVFAYSKRIILATEPQNADIVFVTGESMLMDVMEECNVHEEATTRPIVFVTDYRLLKDSKDIVGAFYWRKGRSQLLFVKKRLEAKGIALSLEYKKYMIEEL